MERFAAEYAGVMVILLAGLVAIVGWYLRSDRKQIVDQLAILGGQIKELTCALERQRDELHRAIMGHETRLATLEGALRWGRRGGEEEIAR